MKYAHILTIGTAKVWHWTLARKLNWRTFFLKLTKISGKFFPLGGAWISHVVSLKWCRLLWFLSGICYHLGRVWRLFRPGNDRPGFQKQYTFGNVYITDWRDLKMGRGKSTWLWIFPMFTLYQVFLLKFRLLQARPFFHVGTFHIRYFDSDVQPWIRST